MQSALYNMTLHKSIQKGLIQKSKTKQCVTLDSNCFREINTSTFVVIALQQEFCKLCNKADMFTGMF